MSYIIEIDKIIDELQIKINQIKPIVNITNNQIIPCYCFDTPKNVIPKVSVPIHQPCYNETNNIKIEMVRIPSQKEIDDRTKWMIEEQNSILWQEKKKELDEQDRQFKIKQKEMELNKQLEYGKQMGYGKPKSNGSVGRQEPDWKEKADEAQRLFIQKIKKKN